MNELTNHIREYAQLLKEGSVWHNSGQILAPVLGDADNGIAQDDYIYEFYCYICIIVDLRSNYDIVFIEGEDKFQYKFPEKAALKKGKPRFHAYKEDKLEFQICAGTKIRCEIDSEKNHPDISFQIPESSEDPSETDLIIILDAKFKEGKNSALTKDDVYKFSVIVDLFDLRKAPILPIKFNRYSELYGNCLITNAGSYSKKGNYKLLNKYVMKEVIKFYPNKSFDVLG